jgi:predicted SprT family Zn-dependent metalloprotease
MKITKIQLKQLIREVIEDHNVIGNNDPQQKSLMSHECDCDFCGDVDMRFQSGDTMFDEDVYQCPLCKKWICTQPSCNKEHSVQCGF